MSAAHDDTPRGFVPMRDYLKLQERCDELEERLALLSDEGRSCDMENAISLIRLRVRTAPKSAKYLALHLRSKRRLLHSAEAAEFMELRQDCDVGVHVWRLNRDAQAQGGPVLVRGRCGSGGRLITDEGRAWLATLIPELFPKAAEGHQ